MPTADPGISPVPEFIWEYVKQKTAVVAYYVEHLLHVDPDPKSRAEWWAVDVRPAFSRTLDDSLRSKYI